MSSRAIEPGEQPHHPAHGRGRGAFHLLATSVGLALAAGVAAAYAAGYYGSTLLAAAAVQFFLAVVGYAFVGHAARLRRRIGLSRPEAAETPDGDEVERRKVTERPAEPTPGAASAWSFRGWGDDAGRPQEPPDGGTQGGFSAWGDTGRREIEEQAAPLTEEDLANLRFAHFIGLTLSVIGAGVIPAATLLYRSFTLEPAPPIPSDAATALAIVALAGSCVWLVLARTFIGTPRQELAERTNLAMTARESFWAGILVAAGAFASISYPLIASWIGRAILIWLLAVGFEWLVRLVAARFAHEEESPAAPDEGTATPATPGFVSPGQLALREGLFVAGNPVASVFATVESKFGVSFRSSWAIRFVRMATVPTVFVILLLYWGLSSLVIVGKSERAVRETLGRRDGVLGPGLHFKLPWPFARVRPFPVKAIKTMDIGFRRATDEPIAYLWTQSHGEEFSLALGGGNEAVGVNAVLYYKIREDDPSLLHYAYQTQNPEAQLENLAYRTLMRLTQTMRLHETDADENGEQDGKEPREDHPETPAILSADRSAFARELRETVQRLAQEERLGLEVVDIALVNLHPPIQAAETYLDVISAEIDRETHQLRARRTVVSQTARAASESHRTLRDAEIYAAQRISEADRRRAEFSRLNDAKQAEVMMRRLWYRMLEETLPRKRLIIVDEEIAGGEGGVLLDLRPPGAPAAAETSR